MNFDLPFLPNRSQKPRKDGLTMIIDKGLSLMATQSMCEAASDLVDFAKFGFGTALITRNLEAKIAAYRDADIIPYFGGTLFELFYARGLMDDFCRYVERYKMEYVEVSDGTIFMNPEEKLEAIRRLSKDFTVISEVGSKLSDVTYSNAEWVAMMSAELSAGAWKVIAEARESGKAGIYNEDGSSNKQLIDDIVASIPMENIIWEAPNKDQQAMFVNFIGANVNLGNIATNEIIALEALRLGLRSDTFFNSIPENEPYLSFRH